MINHCLSNDELFYFLVKYTDYQELEEKCFITSLKHRTQNKMKLAKLGVAFLSITFSTALVLLPNVASAEIVQVSENEDYIDYVHESMIEKHNSNTSDFIVSYIHTRLVKNPLDKFKYVSFLTIASCSDGESHPLIIGRDYAYTTRDDKFHSVPIEKQKRYEQTYPTGSLMRNIATLVCKSQY